jgi:uncharacterized repeat protein (TIGR03803 family)
MTKRVPVLTGVLLCVFAALLFNPRPGHAQDGTNDYSIARRAEVLAHLMDDYDLDTSCEDDIPGSWRLQYFGTTNINDITCAACDPDGDGYSNLQEYNLGTDPTNSASYPTSIPAGLVVWWKLDEGTNTTVEDSSGNEHSGTLQGDPLPIWTNGVVSGALNFDGSQNFVGSDCAISQTFTAITMECWFTANSVSGENPPILSTVHDDNPDYEGYLGAFSIFNPDVRPDLGYLVSFFMIDKAASVNTNGFDGNYHQVVGVWDGSLIQLYYDGIWVGTTNASAASVTADCYVRLAFQDTNGGCFLGGNIGEIRIYNRALGSNEVAAIYNTDTIGDGIPDWWRYQYFGSGTTTDSTSCASCDPEGDSLSNLQKYQLGLNPFVSYAISVPPIVIANSSGNTASIADAGSGASYSWSINNGTIDSGASTRNISWSAAGDGVVTLTVQLTTAGGSFTPSGFANISPCVLAADLTVPSSVLAGSVNNTASVPNPLTVVYSFTNGIDGATPVGVVQGAGIYSNLYGAAEYGGTTNGDGTLFMITPQGTLTTLWQFNYNIDGSGPSALVQGNSASGITNHYFYGVTTYGGPGTNGTVFAITPGGSLTNLHSFNYAQGSYPVGLTQGRDGNFYGVTGAGGSNNNGVVFMISSNINTVTFNVLYYFTGGAGDVFSQAILVQGSGTDSNFYGTTHFGGGGGCLDGCGTIFRISPSGTFTNLHFFNGSDGGWPVSGLTLGSNGLFYGTAFTAGSNGCGTAFSITSSGVFTQLYTFGDPNGRGPDSGLLKGFDNNFYGTTVNGGPANNGTAFKLTPQGILTSLHQFLGSPDGGLPFEEGLTSGFTQAKTNGYLYGATLLGGTSTNCYAGCGTIFQLNPSSYFWSITGGAITSGQGTPNITWTAGYEGTATICVTITNFTGCSTNICSDFIPINPPIATGAHHSLAILMNGTLWTWGGDDQNQLGDGSTDPEAAPIPITNPLCGPAQLTNAVALAGGYDYSVAVDANGVVWSWGDGESGELGTGGTTNVLTPSPITGISNVVGVAAGTQHTLALCADGTVFAWGDNSSGELGTGSSFIQTNFPAQLSGLPQIVAIAAGFNFSLAVDTTGLLWGWGQNPDGQLGTNVASGSESSFTNRPTLVAGISNVIAVATGENHAVALTTNKMVWTWGDNTFGELGRSGSASVPGPVTNLVNVIAIAAGYDFTLAVTSNGQVYAWGHNDSGQLGTNGISSSSTPIPVTGLSNAVLVSAHPDGTHCLAVAVNQGTNQYYAWGANYEGQVGDGAADDDPVGVAGNDNQITPALLHFCDACTSCVQLGTGGVFTAQCTGTLRLYFNDTLGGAYGDNSGAYTAKVFAVGVTNATNVVVKANNGQGVAVGIVTKGSNYNYSASGYCIWGTGQGIVLVDPNGNNTNGVSVDCSGFAGGGFCPNSHCFSLVGRIQ